MDIVLAIKIGPGEGGAGESHRYVLKEAKTLNQVMEFVRVKVKPYVGQQTELVVTAETTEKEEVAEPVPEPKKKPTKGKGSGNLKRKGPYPAKGATGKRTPKTPSEEVTEDRDEADEITPEEINKLNSDKSDERDLYDGGRY